ncbi:glycoside hydrolase [Kribbella sp. NBC_00662]|uniref:sialidase family protein n=1 Tax=Kribbella sp. NBC_00662 TaxID=2975969 RepID=UPI0032501F5B
MSSSTNLTPQMSRRALLGAGAAAAAGLAFGTAGPAFADPGPAGGAGKPGGEVPFGPVVVAGQGGRTSYARAVRLSTTAPGKSRTLLATYQGGGGPGFPLYRSDDDGRTWAKQSSVPDASTASGVYLQPFLYELPRAFAGLPKGALLFACNWLGKNFGSTNIQLYASTDGGLTWQFLSTVAQGGPANTTNGATPVWEPFLLLHNDNLICYYSDQRDPNFGQKLAHQTSTDLVTWGPVVDDATGTAYAERPGMTTVARLKGDLWIMTYEFGEPDDPTNPDQNNYTYHVHYRIAKDPESFRFSPDIPLLDQNGAAPNGAPVVSWSQSGGVNGTIIVTGNDDQDFFINRDLGNPGAWTRLSSPMPAGYSRFTIPLEGPGAPQNRGLVFVITGAQYGNSGPVEAGIISLGD